MPPNTTDVVKTLRSLLNSTPNGLIERQLWRDFKEMEGYPVPFRELGFGKFIDFLRATNEFELIQTSEGYHIRARLTKDSVHIAQLVSSQNRAKKKKNAKPMPFVPRRKIELENNWNPPTAYSQAYSQVNGVCMKVLPEIDEHTSIDDKLESIIFHGICVIFFSIETFVAMQNYFPIDVVPNRCQNLQRISLQIKTKF